MSFLRYSMSKNVVTLKSGSEVTQGHRKCYQSIDRAWFPINVGRSIVTIGLSRTVSEINGDVRRKSNENRQFSHPPVFNAPWMGSPWNFVSAQGSQKTRMMGLSDGRKCFPIGLAVLIQYRSVTATQPATQPASHVAVAITLNAKASSLKIGPL